ncbi:uncharacterized protein METZ01_LOCUS96249, partial [marine metagenome]
VSTHMITPPGLFHQDDIVSLLYLGSTIFALVKTL